MTYNGTERRVHTCFITRNREYHTRAGVCVAVRDRNSSVWMSDHRAMGLMMEISHEDETIQGRPLEFASEMTRVRTSAVMDILRPNRNVVEVYNLVAGFAPI